MKTSTYALLGLAVAMLVAGCDSDPTASGPQAPEPFMQALAVDQADVVVDHRGGARFFTGTRSPTHRKLQVSSYDSEADSRVRLQFLGSSPPVVDTMAGVFALVPRNFDGGDNEGNTATYMRGVDLYVAESGTAEITEAYGNSRDGGQMSGSFTFTAVYWCTPAADTDPCRSLPSSFPASAHRIQVQGEFLAVPHGPVQRLCQPNCTES